MPLINFNETFRQEKLYPCYIYGGIDAWSAARVLVSDKVNSKSYLIPGVSHGTARIKNLPEAMQKEFIGKIKEWTGLDCNVDVLKSK